MLQISLFGIGRTRIIPKRLSVTKENKQKIIYIYIYTYMSYYPTTISDFCQVKNESIRNIAGDAIRISFGLYRIKGFHLDSEIDG